MNEDRMDELLQELESAANFMLGMTMDPRLSADIKEALVLRVEQIEKTLEND